jgi:hypothetical protein
MDMNETTNTARPTIMTPRLNNYTTRTVTAIANGELFQVSTVNGCVEMHRATADEADYIVAPEGWWEGEYLVALLPGEYVTIEQAYGCNDIQITHSNGERKWFFGYVRITVR